MWDPDVDGINDMNDASHEVGNDKWNLLELVLGIRETAVAQVPS